MSESAPIPRRRLPMVPTMRQLVRLNRWAMREVSAVRASGPGIELRIDHPPAVGKSVA